MAYPESVLEPGESVLWHRHPHWRAVAPAAVLAPLITAVAGAGGGLIEKHTSGTASTAAFVLLAAAWAGLLWWRCVLPWLRWRSTHFVVTDRRLMVRQGVVARRGFELELDRVSDVRCTRSALDRLVGAGTLVVRSSAGDPLAFHGMPGVKRVQALIRAEAGWS